MIHQDLWVCWMGSARPRTALAGTEPTQPESLIKMSRFILVFGVICWAGVLVDAVMHLVAGDVVVPAAMGLAFILWVSLRQLHESRLAARVPVESGRAV